MTSIETLQNIVKSFCEARDWDQFHNPKDLAIGISTEATELLELFRFKSNEEITLLIADPKFKEKLNDEIADVFFFILRFCQMNQIDLENSFHKKIVKNTEKYPVEKSKGSNKKYDQL